MTRWYSGKTYNELLEIVKKNIRAGKAWDTPIKSRSHSEPVKPLGSLGKTLFFVRPDFSPTGQGNPNESRMLKDVVDEARGGDETGGNGVPGDAYDKQVSQTARKIQAHQRGSQSWRDTAEELAGDKKQSGYLHDVARGRKDPSPELVARVDEAGVTLFETTDELQDAALEIFTQRVGARNRITKPELQDQLKVGERIARRTIEALRKRGYPIVRVAGERGYCWAETWEEFRAGLADYRSRMAAMRDTVYAMEERAPEFFGPPPQEDGWKPKQDETQPRLMG